jgi:plastocyanin
MKTPLSSVYSICILALALWLPLDITSCNTGGTHSAKPVSGSMESDSKDVQVIMKKMAYHPASITVTKGTKVTWIDEQSFIPHNVISETKGLFASDNMHKNEKFSYTFNDTGTFKYYCSHHKKMRGTVIVK